VATVAMPLIGDIGHLGPVVRIGAVLVRQGHHVVAWAPERFRDTIEASGAEFRLNHGYPVRASRSSQMTISAAIAEHAVAFAPRLIEEMFEAGVDLVVHDIRVLWGRVAGEFLGLPRIVSNPIFPGTERYLPPFHPLDPGLSPSLRRGMWDAAARVERCRTELSRRWGVDIGSWVDVLVNAGPVTVSPSTAEITGIPEPAPGWVYAGPLIGPATQRATRSERPFVYVSVGTVFNFRPEAYQLILEALGDEPLDVLLTTGGGRIKPADLEPLPANITARHYADDVPAVLARADLFVTHAGTGSLHEALLAGVPMVCLPQGGDQFAWAGRLEALGVGRVVPPDVQAIRTRVWQTLGDKELRARVVALGARLAETDGEECLARLVERVLDGGFSRSDNGA
jgi:MGT family glycosyltransferase